MNARPAAETPPAVLRGAEGELVSITITTEPRLLEQLLDALARLDFPINPQIYHQAAVAYVYPDGREQVEPVTMVEFPAYAGRLKQVREALQSLGLPRGSLVYKPVLEGIRTGFITAPAPPGAPYVLAVRYRHKGERPPAAAPNSE